MSAGSNNIIIQINDGVSPTIEPKIKGIAAAAIDADSAVTTLKVTLASVNSGNLTGLSNTLRSISTSTTTLKNSTSAMGNAAATTSAKIDALTLSYGNLEARMLTVLATMGSLTAAAKLAGQGAQGVASAAKAAADGTTRLENAGAQTIGRLVGLEAGAGQLGGAFARLGVAAGVAGPLIVGGLAVGAIIGAVLVYNSFAAATRQLIEDQTKLHEQFASNRDVLLDQKETLAGIVGGPLAKYVQELKDIDQKSISVSISNITKELKDQSHWWQSIASYSERYFAGVAAGQAGQGKIDGTSPSIATEFSKQSAIDYINLQEEVRTSSSNSKVALEKDLIDVGQKLTDINKLEHNLSGQQLRDTEDSRKGLQNYYQELLDKYQEYVGKKAIIGANIAKAELKSQKDNAREQLREFNDELSQLKQTTGIVTPQQIVALRQAQIEGTKRPGVQAGSLAEKPAFAENLNALNKSLGDSQQLINKQDAALESLSQRYKNTSDATGAYSVSLKIQAENEKITNELTKAQVPLSDARAKKIYAEADAAVVNADKNRDMVSVYNQFSTAASQKYNTALTAIGQLQHDSAISTQDAAIAQNLANRAYQEAIDPLFTYKEGLQDEINLLGKYGEQLDIANEVQRVQNQLRAQGRQLADPEALTAFLTQLERQKQIQQDLNKLYEDNAGAVLKLTLNQVALNEAVGKGIITEQQYKIATAQNNVALANQAILQQKGATVQDQVVAGIGKYIQGYQGLTKGLSDAYGQAFATIADGAANSIGKAIAFNQDLGDAMLNVARTVGGDLISAFIKLGIQWVITETLGKVLSKTSVLSSTLDASALAAAWAPAAALASLATLGANAGPAAAGLTTTVALSEVLGAIKFANGGWVQGARGVDQIPALLTHGEFVVNAGATQRNRAALEAMNSGAAAVRAGSSVGSSGALGLNIKVIHDGSTAIAVQQISHDEVRIIAKQESERAVNTLAPSVVASDMHNPNSRTSKALTQNYPVQRRR